MSQNLLTRARTRLLLKDPFLGAASLYLEIEERPLEWWERNCPWTQPTAATDGHKILYYAPFVEGLDTEERMFLVAHEANHCFPSGTLIMGRNGLTPIEDLQAGDFVWGREGNFTKVVAPMNRHYVGEMITIKPACGLEFQVTPEHPILVSRRVNPYKAPTDHRGRHYRNIKAASTKYVQDAKFVRAGDLDPERDLLLFPLPKTQGKGKTRLHTTLFRTRDKYTQKHVRMTEDVAYFLGWWVGDGTMGKPWAGSSTWFGPSKDKRVISLTLGMKDPHAKLRQIIETSFFRKTQMQDLSEVHRADPKQARRIYFSAVCLSRYLTKYFTDGQGKKKVPAWFLAMQPNIIQAFITGLRESDGHISKAGEYTIVNTSKAVMGTVALLLMKLGRLPRLDRRIKPDPNHQDIYTLGWREDGKEEKGTVVGRYWALPIRKYSKAHFEGTVYNVETKHHTYGLPFVMTHNCLSIHHTRRENRDHILFNVACDYAIHDIFTQVGGWKLTQGALYDPRFKDLSAEAIYSILKQEQEAFDKSGGKEGKNHKGSGGGIGIVLDARDANGDPVSKAGMAGAAQDWVGRAVQCLDAAKSCGAVHGCYQRMVGEALEPKIPWEEQLRRFVRDGARRAGDDYNWHPLNRRYLNRGIAMPTIEKVGMGVLDIHVDLSGSIGQKEMDRFAAEMRGIRDAVAPELTRIIYFDTEVCKVDQLGAEDRLEIEGIESGGGTDLSVAFVWARDSGRRPEVTVVLTDLCCGTFADKPPEPVIWASMMAGSAPYGEILVMEQD